MFSDTEYPNSLTGSEVYDYDANSNRTLLTDVLNTTTDNYVTDTLSNKLTSITGLTNVSYLYDANGNITSKLDAAGLGQTYSYNAQNRLASVTVMTAGNVNTLTTYAHNALGQRVSKTTDIGTTLFGYGKQGELTGIYNQDGTAQEEIIYFAGAPVATLRGIDRFYIHTDHLGTPRRISDSTKTTRLFGHGTVTRLVKHYRMKMLMGMEWVLSLTFGLQDSTMIVRRGYITITSGTTTHQRVDTFSLIRLD